MSTPEAPAKGGPPDGDQAFGWTGVKTERYSKWSGKLDSRSRIVRRMITSCVSHDMKSPGVIILIVLSWVFSVLFTVMTAGFGGVSLEMDPDQSLDFAGLLLAGSDEVQGVDISFHQVIMNDSVAVYDLTGLSPTNRTLFTISGIQSGWSAFINQSGTTGVEAASLVVTPPINAPGFSTAMIEVKAKTDGRVDKFKTITTIAADPMMTLLKFGMIVEFEEPVINGTAGEAIKVDFRVKNTGSIEDTYNITLLNKPDGWKVDAFVEGAQIDLKTKKEVIPGRFTTTITYKVFSVTVPAGGLVNCSMEFETTETSSSRNTLSLAANSGQDPLVFGTYSVSVNLEDTEKIDLTGRIIFDQVMGLQILWALFLAAVVGSKMIATDLSEKSYNLYFARPITKTDYLIGKFGNTSILLSMVTLVPTLVAYTFLILLSDISDTYVWDHLWVWGSIIVYNIVVIITFTTLALALSSLTSRRFYAAAAVVVIFMVTSIIAQIVIGAFALNEGPLISIQSDIDMVGRMLFDLGDDLNYDFPWYYGLGVLVPLWVISTIAVWIKVEKTELSE